LRDSQYRRRARVDLLTLFWESRLRLKIHRGTREIGGTCIELESDGSRILLDLGLPLNAADLASTPLPDIDGLTGGSASPLAIILSHGHLGQEGKHRGPAS
jgi:predicted metal-dependent RNase